MRFLLGLGLLVRAVSTVGRAEDPNRSRDRVLCDS